MTSQKDASIDFLKFIAVILITNSHMGILYSPNYVQFATGGAIGNSLFFFCSGFTLFLGRIDSFDNWYKRRINRIYPTIFAMAFYSSFLFTKDFNVLNILFHGGGWFVSCIMIYYIILYIVRKYLSSYLLVSLIFASTILIVCYLLTFISPNSTYWSYKNIYASENYFAWCLYFMPMLIGATMGYSKKVLNYGLINNTLKLFLFTITYYGFLFICRKYSIASKFELISIVFLIGIIFSFYKVSHNVKIAKILNGKLGWIVAFISSMCLEIYLVQFSLITDKMNNIFPLNLVFMFVIILFAAYLVKVLSRLFVQTFREGNYQWKLMVSVWK